MFAQNDEFSVFLARKFQSKSGETHSVSIKKQLQKIFPKTLNDVCQLEQINVQLPKWSHCNQSWDWYKLGINDFRL